jgi:MFS transporter, DHA2 family, lincomycin resistance protein
VSETAISTQSAIDAQTRDATTAARDKLVLSLLLISTFVVILNETIMSVALPPLMRDLNIEASAAQWLTSAFMLTMAVVIPVTGFMLQRLTTRTVFITAMTLFCVGTFFAAVAPGFEALVFARIVQASGTAVMMPLMFTTVLTLVPHASRGRVMANISVVISVAPAIGPTISGLILSVLHWRWMFILVLPIAIASLVLGVLRIQNVTEPRRTQLDVLSVILSVIAFGGLVYGLSNIGAAPDGIRATASWLPLLIGAITLALFVLRQLTLQRREMPLLDLRTFKTKPFTIAMVMMAMCTISLFGTIVLLPIYTQNVLHFPALTTGLVLLPGGLIMGLLAPSVGRTYDRIGPSVLVISGSIIVTAALWGMLLLNSNSTVWAVLIAHVTLCTGFALLFTPLFTAGLGGLPMQLYSHGSAIVGTLQQVVGAAGVALFVSVMAATIMAQRQAGVAESAATAAGIEAAFVYGAVMSLATIPLAFFIRRPAQTEAVVPAAH